MELQNDDSPLPPQLLKVGIVYNLKERKEQRRDDEDAEYDSIDTVFAIRGALEKHGCEVTLLEADANLPDKLRDSDIDIAFNIAEGIRGRGREAEIPALLNLYGIPYTGSDETTLCIALDKALTKRLLRSYHIKTPNYSLITCGSSVAAGLSGVRYPSIVKPNAEGSSKGIRGKCVVRGPEELKNLLAGNLEAYREDMLVEEYIDGREFTVGVLGNGASTRVFEPMEIAFKHPTQEDFSVYSFDVKREYKKHIEYRCPSDISGKIRKALINTTKKVYDILGCKDFTRMDYRVSNDGEVYFIEVNPLPGLAPGYSDYPMLADFCGMGYDELIASVLDSAAARQGLRTGGAGL